MYGILFWSMLISILVRFLFNKWTTQSVIYWFCDTIIWVGFTAYWVANPNNVSFGWAVFAGLFSAVGVLMSVINWTRASELRSAA